VQKLFSGLSGTQSFASLPLTAQWLLFPLESSPMFVGFATAPLDVDVPVPLKSSL